MQNKIMTPFSLPFKFKKKKKKKGKEKKLHPLDVGKVTLTDSCNFSVGDLGSMY